MGGQRKLDVSVDSGARRTGRQPVEREFERVQIALPAETADHSFGLVGKIRVVPERLAAMYVRQVNLDERDTDARRASRIATLVASYAAGLIRMKSVFSVRADWMRSTTRAFVVALERRQFNPGVRCAIGERLIDLRERHAAINLGFPCAEKIEVGAQCSTSSRVMVCFFFRGIGRTLALIKRNCLVSFTDGALCRRSFDGSAAVQLLPIPRDFRATSRLPAANGCRQVRIYSESSVCFSAFGSVWPNFVA